MKLSLGDKVALLYTSEGSQRKVAARLGISHQTVGRMLRANYENRVDTITRYETRSDLTSAIDRSFAEHVTKARKTARAQGLPFDAAVPIYAARMPTVKIDRETGEVIHELGNRVHAEHLHWITDRLRDAWIARAHKSNKFATVTVRSTVNRHDYNKRANQRAAHAQRTQGLVRTKDQRAARDHLANRNHQTAEVRPPIVPVFTPRTFLDPRFSTASILEELRENLQTRHAPSLGDDARTSFADAVYLQIDTRTNKPHAPSTTRRKKARAKPGKAR